MEINSCYSAADKGALPPYAIFSIPHAYNATEQAIICENDG